MWSRGSRAIVRRRLRRSPAVALVGPRQSGKTTLARSLGGLYFDLEHGPDRLKLDLQWEALQSGTELVVLDEAQNWPEVFPRLRTAIDKDRRRRGRFLLLGSVSPALMTQVSESLAGRLALVELPPFSLAEVPRVPVERLWHRGGYPDGGVRGGHAYPRWQIDYVSLMAQRDLPAWGLPAKPQVTMRLSRMLAGVHGQTWNASQVGKSLGLSYHTVNTYLDFLEGAFLIRRLPPYHANIGKRLVKSPKVYWRDSGLLHALLGVGEAQALVDQPWVGASWEGFVIEQLLAALALQDRPAQPFYLRTSDQHEIDLVLEYQGRLAAVEIKLTASPGPDDLRRLHKAADLIGANRRVLVSQTRQTVAGDRGVSCNPTWLVRHLQSGLALW
jgi:uncharacterized protein